MIVDFPFCDETNRQPITFLWTGRGYSGWIDATDYYVLLQWWAENVAGRYLGEC